MSCNIYLRIDCSFGIYLFYPNSIDISPELRDLLEKLLRKDPAKRITIAEIREHPWVLKTARPLPSREENCAEEISVSEEEIKGAFKQFYTPIHILVRKRFCVFGGGGGGGGEER